MPFTLFNSLGTLLIGATVGLMLYALARTFRLKLPAWVYPTAIGVSMILFQVYNDATWFRRTAGSLPETHVVVASHTATSALRFWSYAIPIVERFAVLDRTSVKRNPDVPGLVIADLILVTRFQPTVKITQIFDCAGHRRGEAGPAVTFDANGMPENVPWTDVPADDAMLTAACSG